MSKSNQKPKRGLAFLAQEMTPLSELNQSKLKGGFLSLSDHKANLLVASNSGECFNRSLCGKSTNCDYCENTVYCGNATNSGECISC